MNRLDEYGYAGLYKALKHKYKYALSTNLPCVSRHSQFLALLCIFPELISLQESCGSRFRLISRLFGCLATPDSPPYSWDQKWPPFVGCESCQVFLQKYEIIIVVQYSPPYFWDQWWPPTHRHPWVTRPRYLMNFRLRYAFLFRV